MVDVGKGYINLFRSIQDHWLWHDKPVSRGQAWVDMLLWASHKDREAPTTEGFVKIHMGEYIRTLRQMAETWGWSKNRVSRFLKVLQEANMIRLKNGTRTTHVYICKYEVYRELLSKSGTRTDQSRDKVGTKKGHNNKLERIKKNYNSMSGTVKPYPDRVNYYFDNIDLDLRKTWEEAYPNIDIDYQLGKAKSWLLSNTNRAKRDFNKFVNNWLSKAMEMPGQSITKPTPQTKHKYICTECEEHTLSTNQSWQLKCGKCDEFTMVGAKEYGYMKVSKDRRDREAD